MRPSRFILTLTAISALLASNSANAAFSDVPSSHPYKESIEWLAAKDIVKGNPDGTFTPDKAVDRASFLTMLYRAKGITAPAATKDCFKDVPKSAWFAAVVCDASKNGYVNGYDGGMFKPGQEVNRVEALKMMMTVLGIKLEDVTTENTKLVPYIDISLSAWYAKFLVTAHVRGILPLPAWPTATFEPEKSLRRGEAAAYIHRGLTKTSVSRASASSAAARSSAGTNAADNPSVTKVTGVTLPFSQVENFVKKTPSIFRFDLTSSQVVSAKINVQEGTVTCRLFKIVEGVIPSEYYLGHQNNKDCWMLVALAKGSYQFEVQPTVSGAAYEMQLGYGTGDGNDGFSEAKLLPKGEVRTNYLEIEDYSDWYTFTLSEPKTLTVEVAGSPDITCTIYPLENVDLYGFSGPTCNTAYEYPKGTYMISVIRKQNRLQKETYTVRYK